MGLNLVLIVSSMNFVKMVREAVRRSSQCAKQKFVRTHINFFLLAGCTIVHIKWVSINIRKPGDLANSRVVN